MRSLTRWARRAAAAPIRGYQRWISPLLGQRCRYYPSCSSYAIEAIRRRGVVRGSLLAGWRLLRCNPFSPGGVDHVPGTDPSPLTSGAASC
jgi:uncharacterized protein